MNGSIRWDMWLMAHAFLLKFHVFCLLLSCDGGWEGFKGLTALMLL